MTGDQPRFKVGDRVCIPGEASVGTVVEVFEDPPISYVVSIEMTAQAGTEPPGEAEEQDEWIRLLGQQRGREEFFPEDELEPG